MALSAGLQLDHLLQRPVDGHEQIGSRISKQFPRARRLVVVLRLRLAIYLGASA